MMTFNRTVSDNNSIAMKTLHEQMEGVANKFWEKSPVFFEVWKMVINDWGKI